MSKTQIFILSIQIYWFNMQNIDILENYPKHMPLQYNFIFKPYVQVFAELHLSTINNEFCLIFKLQY